MASNLVAMASNLIAMASTLQAVAFNLVAMVLAESSMAMFKTWRPPMLKLLICRYLRASHASSRDELAAGPA